MADQNTFVAIPWADGTTDYIYLNFSKVESTGIISVSSDSNNFGMERTKIFGFQGVIPANQEGFQAIAYLRVLQQVDNLVVATFESQTSIYDDNKAGYIQ